MINILIVDDSPTETAILKNIIAQDPALRVIGVATNGKEAVALTQKLKPDLITMDIEMPILNGLEATKMIMAEFPTPIVVISSKLDNKEMNTTFLALEAGALTVIEKPKNITSPKFATTQKNILGILKAMAEIQVIKRRFFSKKTSPVVPIHKSLAQNFEIIVIGTSVGGPQALKKILSDLPASFPIPIMIVQHMTSGFMNGFTQWLNDSIALKVKNAMDEEVIEPGTIYFAPDQFHLQVKRSDQQLRCHLFKGDPVSGFCPSINVLLKSVASVCGKQSIGILLTGMGSDGAEGLLEIKRTGGHTLIQDPKSTIVFGMAGVAQSLGAVTKIVELDQFARYLIEISK